MLPSITLILACLQSGSWEALLAPPAETGSGAAVAVYDGDLYLLRGGGSHDFWRCDADEGWIALADLPVDVSSGGALASGSTPYLYALADSRLWRYSIAANTWSDLGTTPEVTGSGASMNRLANSLYVLRGGSKTDFWRYEIEAQAWELLPPAPANIGHGSASLHCDDEFHVLRGNGSDDRFRYSIASASWTIEAPLPETVGSGGAMTTHDSAFVILRGLGSATTWRIPFGSPYAEPWLDAPMDAVAGTLLFVWQERLHVISGQQEGFHCYVPPPPLPSGTTAPVDDINDPDDGCGGSARGSVMPGLAVTLAVLLRRRR